MEIVSALKIIVILQGIEFLGRAPWANPSGWHEAPSVVIYQYDGQQVEQVHADTQTGHIGDEYAAIGRYEVHRHGSPTSGSARIPQRWRQKRRRKPHPLQQRTRRYRWIDECAHHAWCLDGNQLAGGHLLPVADDELACQMGDGPEEEHDADGTEECVHRIHHLGYLRGITGEVCEEIAHEHEECPRWVTDLLLVGSCNKTQDSPRSWLSVQLWST